MFSRVLAIAPHTDDVELGCGGTVSRLINEGSRVEYVAFSSCEESLPKELPRTTLRDECASATSKLGICSNDLRILDFRVRRFSERRQEILDEMILLRNMAMPDLVLVPASDDIHQDHGVIHAEALRAFKRSSILGYELPWNSRNFAPRMFFRLTEKDLGNKVKAMGEYNTQAGRPYMTPELVRSLASLRGLQSGCLLAEAFEVIRWIA